MVTTTRRRKALRATVTTFELTQFTWVPDKACLVIERSDLLGPLRTDPGLPVRFDIHSPKTDRVERFVHTGVIMQDAEDIGAWMYVAENEECPVKRVIVYND